MDKPPSIRQFTIKEGDHEMDVVIPESGDKAYDDYLEQAEREKTSEQLKKKPPKPPSKVSKEDLAGIAMEKLEFKGRKRRGNIRKYY